MQKNLVIVESPAKAKTIEKFLGSDFKVMSSYGHIRDLKKKELSIDTDTLVPEYEIPVDKERVVRDLRQTAAKVETIWLASDEDREGEAISWHLCEVLGLDQSKTNRIVFHEITKPAILRAIEEPRRLNMDLVDAQQARRVLDRLVGFKLSPVLWRKVKPALSAGRVQSVAVRLIVEREREIQSFKTERFFRVSAIFQLPNEDGTVSEFRAELASHLKTEDDVRVLLEKCKTATFTVEEKTVKPTKRTPAPPFTTSTLQQEAARKLGFTVSQTMMVAQMLYENGQITYMRTDSVNLSNLCINASKEAIVSGWGETYSQSRNYHTRSKGAQEAHEAIRPTYMDRRKIDGTTQERRLYDLIWKRTIASQMADAELEKTQVVISMSNSKEQFIAKGEVVTFDGFLKVYRESREDEDDEANEGMLPRMNVGDSLERGTITATERFTMPPMRYSEASLVHKLEELGIGRPSTYAPTISTIQQREYVVKGDSKGEERSYIILTLDGDRIRPTMGKESVDKDKGKLLPTDIGTVVNDFLMESFPEIMDYNFTASVEQQFDQIADGKEEWHKMLQKFYSDFEPVVERTMQSRTEHRAGEREIGKDPKTGKPVFAKIGRFGPVIQVGATNEEEKPRFAQLPKGKSMETITLEEALELFKLPRTLGLLEDQPITVGSGRFGPYILYKKKYTSIPKNLDPLLITIDQAVRLLDEKNREEQKRHLRHFSEDEKMEILNGRYGPYIAYDGKNYRIPKNMHDRAATLSYDECMELIKNKGE